MDKDTFFTKKFSINCGGKYLDLARPRVMGILNLTPDSFYDGGRHLRQEDMMKHVEKMIGEGADIIDVGAYSSRPGARHLSEEEEFKRLAGGLSLIRSVFPEQIISVDTFRSGIARRVILEYGVNMVNDIAAGNMDDQMFDALIEMQVPYILMHMPGTPQDMMDHTNYDDLVGDILIRLGNSVRKLKQQGLKDIIIDPGFGFGKTTDQNYALLAHLDVFRMLELPILAGISRKSMVYKVLGNKPGKALNGTSVLHAYALERGASILRAHDVKEANEAISLYLKMKEEDKNYRESLADRN